MNNIKDLKDLKNKIKNLKLKELKEKMFFDEHIYQYALMYDLVDIQYSVKFLDGFFKPIDFLKMAGLWNKLEKETFKKIKQEFIEIISDIYLNDLCIKNDNNIIYFLNSDYKTHEFYGNYKDDHVINKNNNMFKISLLRELIK